MHVYPASKESKSRRANKAGVLLQNLCIKGSQNKETFQLCDGVHFDGAVLVDTCFAHAFIIIVSLPLKTQRQQRRPEGDSE